MKNTLTLLATICALAIAFPLGAEAQETGSGTTGTQSGETVAPEKPANPFSLEAIQQQEIERQWEERLQRSEDFRSQWLQERKFMEALAVSEQQYRLRRTTDRATCRAAIRKASLYEKTQVSFDCYRAELASNLERLEKDREYVERAPGVSDDVRWLTLTRIDLLSDALAVIINAIDSNVYQTIEELQEAKYNLMISYRKPLWTMMTRVRADKMLSWTASLMTRIGTMEDVELLDRETTDALFEAVACLGDTEGSLKDALAAQDFETADAKLTESYALLESCVIVLREAGEGAAIVPQEEAAVANPSEETEIATTSQPAQRTSSRTTTDTSHTAASDKPVDTSSFIASDDDEAAPTCNGQPVSRRVQRRMGDSCTTTQN